MIFSTLSRAMGRYRDALRRRQEKAAAEAAGGGGGASGLSRTSLAPSVGVMDLNEEELLGQQAQRFFVLLSVCHTVLVDHSSGKRAYNAEGPDEEALVKAAAGLGVVLTSTDNKVSVRSNQVRLSFRSLSATHPPTAPISERFCAHRTCRCERTRD